MKKLMSKKFKDVRVGEQFYLYSKEIEDMIPILYMKCSYGVAENYMTDKDKESDFYSNCVSADGILDYIFPEVNVWVEAK